MLFNCSGWALSATLVVATLLAKTNALPQFGITKDYSSEVPESYSAILEVDSIGSDPRLNNEQLASVAKEAMRQINANFLASPVVVSVMQDEASGDLYIGSSTNQKGDGMHPLNSYLLNQRIALLPLGAHKNKGACGECNVLRLFEDRNGLGQEPSQGSKVVAWGQSGGTAAVWNPCNRGRLGDGEANGCTSLIGLYPTLIAVEKGTAPNDNWSSLFYLSTEPNPRFGAHVFCQRSEDGGFCGLQPPVASNSSSNATKPATTFSTSTTSLASTSLTRNSSATTLVVSTSTTVTGFTNPFTTLSSTISISTTLTTLTSISGSTSISTGTLSFSSSAISLIASGTASLTFASSSSSSTASSFSSSTRSFSSTSSSLSTMLRSTKPLSSSRTTTLSASSSVPLKPMTSNSASRSSKMTTLITKTSTPAKATKTTKPAVPTKAAKPSPTKKKSGK